MTQPSVSSGPREEITTLVLSILYEVPAAVSSPWRGALQQEAEGELKSPAS